MRFQGGIMLFGSADSHPGGKRDIKYVWRALRKMWKLWKMRRKYECSR